VPGDYLDLILIVLAAAFAVAGYRQGFIIGMMSFVGFVGGVAVGAIIAPRVSRYLASSLNWQAFIAIAIVFGTAVIGMLIASGLGVAVRSRLSWRPVTFLDSVGGAAVNVVAVLLVAWLIGSFVAYAPYPLISRQVNDSAVLQGVDAMMSPFVAPEFSQLRSLLARGPYAQVFSALGAERAVDVAPPDPAVLKSGGLKLARASVVKVEGLAPSCSRRIEGSGFVIAPGRVLTNAHVVAGVTQGQVVITSHGGRGFAAHVVLYDPERDIAVLDVPDLAAVPLKFASTAQSGDPAIVAGYPLDGGFTAVAARVGPVERAVGPDIYQTSKVTRTIYPIRAVVEQGNSGGPLLGPDGEVYGVVFAAATSVPDTGYALTAAEVAPDLNQVEQMDRPVSTGACQ
jgi:S1-C subfamily serine protease